jgi:hypothetical protein
MVQDIILKADCHSARQKISSFLTETEGSSPCSQKPATGPSEGNSKLKQLEGLSPEKYN